MQFLQLLFNSLIVLVSFLLRLPPRSLTAAIHSKYLRSTLPGALLLRDSARLPQALKHQSLQSLMSWITMQEWLWLTQWLRTLQSVPRELLTQR